MRLKRAERVVAHDDVLRHAEVGEEGRLLVDDGEPGVAGVVGGVEVDRRAAHEHLAAVAAHDAAEDLDERRLAGAVLAHEPAYLAGPDGQVAVAQRADGAVGLRGVAKLHHRGGVGGLVHAVSRPVTAGVTVRPLPGGRMWSIRMPLLQLRPKTIET